LIFSFVNKEGELALMKKVFLFSIMLLTVLLGLSLRKEVKAEH
jgi:hypothetical protein